MLSRVARQKNAIFHLRKANAHRALAGSSLLRFHSSSSRPGPAPVHDRPRRPSFQSQRNLATAADQSAVDHGSSISLGDYSPPVDRPSLLDRSGIGMPGSFDASSLIIMDDAPQTQPKVFRKVKGIGGDEDEMLANFNMSIKVGRFDRAAALLNRLRFFYAIGSPEYLALHNIYLKGMVSHMIVTRQYQLALPLQKWFEVDMPAGGVEPDATTYAVMIRMALRMHHGSKRDRSARRYWEMAKRANLQEELLTVEVLTDLDLGELSRICYEDLRQPFERFEETDCELALSEQPSEPTDHAAEVLPVEQKGLGLSALKESLSVFSGSPRLSLPEDFNGDEAEKNALLSQLRQRRLEADTIKSASKRWRAETEARSKAGSDLTAGRRKTNAMTSQWHADLAARIQEELQLADVEEAKPVRTKEQKERYEYGVFLRCLDSDTLAAITILSVMLTFSKGGMDKGLKVSAIASTIGREVRDEVVAQSSLAKVDKGDFGRTKRLKDILANRAKGRDGRVRWRSLSEKIQKEEPELAWSPRVIMRIGAVLTKSLIDVGKVSGRRKDPQTGELTTSMQPAFQHAYQIVRGRRLGLIHLHPEIVEFVAREPPADILGRHLPMVCKPKPWTGSNEGGYLVYQSNLVRSTPGEALQPAYLDAALENNGLEDIRHGLHVLGSTGWVVNRDVFDVMLEAWNSGEALGSLAPLDPDLPVPPKPEPDAGYTALKNWQTQVVDIEDKRSGFHSVRCFQNFQLEVARSFLNETFYLPHNMDFRGRAYPLPPYLNQMGADTSRGLLLFSDAKTLGENGLRWLKIQIANLAGFDKASMSEREQFAMDNLDNILDSADNGLHGKRWWLQSEDPWQCLAACCELRNALRYSDPTKYQSRLPIHQDGSCNGLQHYAALGGDTAGAQQVNLEPSDRPSDVYTGVSAFVKEAVAKDAAKGVEIAKTFEGRITRKVVKQTVMTNVYGVTFIGAMRQVKRQLNDHYPELDRETKRQGSLYIARKIFEALGTIFNGAHEIQYWLGDCASRISTSLPPQQIEQMANEALLPTDETARDKGSRSLSDPAKRFRSTVIWTTPLGLPVVQPYRSRKARRVPTALQDLSVVSPNSDDVVSRRKQLQAFPPNFIHSLDATHMFMSANACHKAGLTFSAVHDSFWTHACDVDEMNTVLREAFVKMHSDDIIGRLAAEFDVRFGKNLFLAKVKSDSKIGRAIRGRRKRGFKNNKLVELLDEHRRQTLLRSDDPAEQAEGRAMETCASLFEEMGCTDADLTVTSSLGEMTVGHVPEDIALAERKPDSAPDTNDPAIQSLFNDIELMESNSHGYDTDAGAADEQTSPKKKKAYAYTWLWMPLRFRPVPTKGSWDLKRIRDSKYFFS